MDQNIRETKRLNRVKIIKYISERGEISKAEIASGLHLSMPTVLQNVKELAADGLILECGEYESTGGRKARALSIAEDSCYAAGVDITANHISFVLINAKREIVKKDRIRLPFKDSSAYYQQMTDSLHHFLDNTEIIQGKAGPTNDLQNNPQKSGRRKIDSCKIDHRKITGVGISLPGIVNKEEKLLIRSHVLGLRNVSYQFLQNLIGFPIELENDANSAACAERTNSPGNSVFLSLSDTVGGAVCLNNRLYPGENFKSAEFGHMVIEKNGRPCYCGKKGCVDAYCSAKVLQKAAGGTLDLFFKKLREGDLSCKHAWEDYLDALAVTVTNLRMAFDCDIVLGGYAGGYLEEFLPELGKYVMKYNNFDPDTSYLRTGKYKLEAAAYGVSLQFIDRFFENC